MQFIEFWISSLNNVLVSINFSMSILENILTFCLVSNYGIVQNIVILTFNVVIFNKLIFNPFSCPFCWAGLA